MTKNEEKIITLTVDEAKYALKCVRYLASGCTIYIDEESRKELWGFAEKLYKSVEQASGDKMSPDEVEGKK